jgi:hypothetical protein
VEVFPLTAYRAAASSAHPALAKEGPADPWQLRVRDAEAAVEALFRRQELGLVPQMPLADARRDVAEFFQAFGDREWLGVQPVRADAGDGRQEIG